MNITKANMTFKIQAMSGQGLVGRTYIFKAVNSQATVMHQVKLIGECEILLFLLQYRQILMMLCCFKVDIYSIIYYFHLFCFTHPSLSQVAHRTLFSKRFPQIIIF